MCIVGASHDFHAKQTNSTNTYWSDYTSLGYTMQMVPPLPPARIHCTNPACLYFINLLLLSHNMWTRCTSTDGTVYWQWRHDQCNVFAEWANSRGRPFAYWLDSRARDARLESVVDSQEKAKRTNVACACASLWAVYIKYQVHYCISNAKNSK